MIYEIDKCYDFKVIEHESPDYDYFSLEVDGPDGPAVTHLKKLEFQRTADYREPSSLYCRVKSFDENGLPVLTHNVTPYVSQLYERTAANGEAFELQVFKAPDNPAEEMFTLRDRFGIFYRLMEPEGLLTKDQIVRCKFDVLTPRYFQIHRVDEGARLPFYSPEHILAGSGAGRHLSRLMLRKLRELPELDAVRAELKVKNPLWVITAGRSVLRLLPGWLLNAKLKERNAAYTALIGALSDSLLFLLEGSIFLNAATPEHRRSLQMQLTEMVDTLVPYILTLRIIADDSIDEFVESILDKLSKSGHLYHPAERFAIMMIIFRLHPDKVGVYLNRIFESIFSRDLENWKREPFRSAFVEQFEIYVREARRQFESMPMAETRRQKSDLETIITAIALQLLLADPEKSDLSRSWSLFYRFVTLLRPLKTEALLTKSFLSLMGADIKSPISYSELKQPMMMITQSTILPAGDLLSLIRTTHRYTNAGVELAISPSGIVLRPEGRDDITERAIPETLMPWLKTQVMINGVKSLSGTKLRRLSDHRLWWHDIETRLFEKRLAREETVTRRKPEKDERVYVVLDRVDNSGDMPKIFCHIEDPDYTGGNGLIYIKDGIIGYKLLDANPMAFRTPTGAERGFLATVKGVDDNGFYEFSLLDAVDAFINESLDYESEYVAVITGDFSAKEYSAISSVGVGLFLEREDTDYRQGSFVRFRLKNKGRQGQLRGIITGPAEVPQDAFRKSDAFNNLLISIGEVDASASEEANAEVMRDLDEILTADEIRELIEIIRFKAIAETDLIKAYDLLSYARLLALLISDNTLAEKLATHASLLTLHQFFATNSRIDAERLEELQAAAESDPLLKMIYHRLEMVSWLTRQDKNAELYATADNPANELEGQIARMVLAYNMINASTDDDHSVAAEIKQKIMEKLNVNNETRRGKYYGSESKYLEFKTSIVYPAVAPGAEMREDPAAQQFHILSRIAGLLNADGGHLFLGVNNDGYEVGMHDDFKYFERHPMMARAHKHHIKNIEHVSLFIEDLVNEYFPASAARKIAISVDPEAEKGVVMIDVERSLDPVLLSDRLFVRQSGQSTREYFGKDRAEFIAERAELKAEREHMLALSKTFALNNDDIETAAGQATAAEAPGQPEPAVGQPEPAATAQIEPLHTSHWRPNVLHYYEDGYSEPYGYLYFTADGKVYFSQKDRHEEDESRLALVIPHESSQDCLLLAFEGERAVRVPLTEIYNHGENAALPIWNDGESLMFAAIVGREDSLLCIGADSKDSLWKRVIKMSAIEQGHLSSAPKRFHDAPIHHTVAYDIVDSAALDRFADCSADRLGNKRFGATLRVKEGSPDMDYKLNETYKLCSPQN